MTQTSQLLSVSMSIHLRGDLPCSIIDMGYIEDIIKIPVSKMLLAELSYLGISMLNIDFSESYSIKDDIRNEDISNMSEILKRLDTKTNEIGPYSFASLIKDGIKNEQMEEIIKQSCCDKKFLVCNSLLIKKIQLTLFFDGVYKFIKNPIHSMGLRGSIQSILPSKNILIGQNFISIEDIV